MNLENGMIIFCEEPKKVGIVTDAAENLVRLDGDEDTTPVDPEFAHLATTEECEGTEFANINLMENTEEVPVNNETAGEMAEEVDLNEDELIEAHAEEDEGVAANNSNEEF